MRFVVKIIIRMLANADMHTVPLNSHASCWREPHVFTANLMRTSLKSHAIVYSVLLA